MIETIDGRLEPFWATGTEGVCWSLENRIRPGYDGLIRLGDGDHLTIFNALGHILWEGIIDLEYERNYQAYPRNPQYGQQAVFDDWVNGLQRDVEPETWARWFYDRHRARLRPVTPRDAHPFDAPAADLASQLTLPSDVCEAFFRSARYQWISWVINQQGEIVDHGLHKDIGFTEAEAMQIIGSPSIETIQIWHTHQNSPLDRAMLLRLALLSGIVGRLYLIFGTLEEINAWLDQQSVPNELLFEQPIRNGFFSLSGLMAIHDLLRMMVEQPPHGFITEITQTPVDKTS
jgi:hypothetical protein